MRGKRNKGSRKSKEGMVILQMRDGTTQVIEGEGLCLDLAYRDGQPYLVVKEGDAGGGERAEDVEKSPGNPVSGR